MYIYIYVCVDICVCSMPLKVWTTLLEWKCLQITSPHLCVCLECLGAILDQMTRIDNKGSDTKHCGMKWTRCHFSTSSGSCSLDYNLQINIYRLILLHVPLYDLIVQHVIKLHSCHSEYQMFCILFSCHFACLICFCARHTADNDWRSPQECSMDTHTHTLSRVHNTWTCACDIHVHKSSELLWDWACGKSFRSSSLPTLISILIISLIILASRTAGLMMQSMEVNKQKQFNACENQ